jgi:hypothetical protein
MSSDILIVKVELKDGWNQEVISIAKIQAARDQPRRLVSTMFIENTIILVFEII